MSLRFLSTFEMTNVGFKSFYDDVNIKDPVK